MPRKFVTKSLLSSLSYTEQESWISLSLPFPPSPFLGNLENNSKNWQNLALVKILKNCFSYKDNVAEDASFQSTKTVTNNYLPDPFEGIPVRVQGLGLY